MHRKRAVLLNRRAGWLTISLARQELGNDDLAAILDCVREDMDHLQMGRDSSATKWIICEDEETHEDRKSSFDGTLESLFLSVDLSENRLSCLKSLVQFIARCKLHLKKGVFVQNDLDDAAVRELAAYIYTDRATSVESLHLGRNRLTATGLTALCLATASHPGYPLPCPRGTCPMYVRAERNRVAVEQLEAALEEVSERHPGVACLAADRSRCGAGRCANGAKVHLASVAGQQSEAVTSEVVDVALLEREFAELSPSREGDRCVLNLNRVQMLRAAGGVVEPRCVACAAAGKMDVVASHVMGQCSHCFCQPCVLRTIKAHLAVNNRNAALPCPSCGALQLPRHITQLSPGDLMALVALGEAPKAEPPKRFGDLCRARSELIAAKELREPPVPSDLSPSALTTEAPEFHTCPVCKCVLRDPVLTRCHCAVCSGCFPKDRSRCPACATALGAEDCASLSALLSDASHPLYKDAEFLALARTQLRVRCERCAEAVAISQLPSHACQPSEPRAELAKGPQNDVDLSLLHTPELAASFPPALPSVVPAVPSPPNIPPPKAFRNFRRVEYDFDPQGPEQIRLEAGALVEVVEVSSGGWAAGVCVARDTLLAYGRAGWFPESFLAAEDPADFPPLGIS